MSLIWSPDYAPVDGDFADVSLLLLGEGTNGSTTILDSSSNNLSVSVNGNAQISTAVSTPFGTGDGVLAFDGTGDYLSTPVTPFQFLHKLTDSWTAEAWIYRLSATQGCLFDTGGASNTTVGTGLYVNADGSAFFGIRQSQGSLHVSLSAPSSTVNTNAWYHVAVCYNQSTVKLFIDGVLLDSVSYNTQTSNNATQSTLKVGVYEYSGTTLGGFFNGYISNLRITKGVARYTENFDVPTAPFPILSPSGRITIADDSLDADARQYIINVEEQDGEELEAGVRTAINNFVVGCKSDGIWNAIKASCLLCGARTLEGALVPLKGTAPTNFNLSGYDRKLGLAGNPVNGRLLTSYTPLQNNNHGAVWLSSQPSVGYILLGNKDGAGFGFYPNTNVYALANNTAGAFQVVSAGIQLTVGFVGIERSSSASYTYRIGSLNGTTGSGNNSTTPLTTPVNVFAGDPAFGNGYPTDARIPFYSLGESLDLALLDTRISDFITAIGAAIP